MKNLSYLPLGGNDIKGLLGQSNQVVYDMFMSHAAFVKTTNVKEMHHSRRATLGQILYRDRRFVGDARNNVAGFFTPEQLKNLHREFFPAALYLDLSKEMFDVYRSADREVLFIFLVDCADMMKSQKIDGLPKGFRSHLGQVLKQLKRCFNDADERLAKITEAFFPVALDLNLSNGAIGVYKNAESSTLWQFLMDCLDDIKAGNQRRERNLRELMGKNRKAAEEESKRWHGRMTKIGYTIFESGSPVAEVISQLGVEKQEKLEENYLAAYHNHGRKMKELIGDRELMRWKKNRSTVSEKEASELKSIGANAIIHKEGRGNVGAPVETEVKNEVAVEVVGDQGASKKKAARKTVKKK